MPRQWHKVTLAPDQTEQTLRSAFFRIAGFDPAQYSDSLELLTGHEGIVYEPSETGGRMCITDREADGLRKSGYQLTPES